MSKIIILFLLFFLPLLINVDNTSAQTSACPDAVRINSSCTSLGTTDSCGYNLCDCPYINTNLGCTYNQDDICPGQATRTCPVNTTPITSCFDSLYQDPNYNCANRNMPGQDGKTYSFGSNVDCWINNSQSVCSGTDFNTGCGYCQGWFYCSCPNGQPTDIACDKQRDAALGCGTFSFPCTLSNSYCPTSTPTPTPTPTPAPTPTAAPTPGITPAPTPAPISAACELSVSTDTTARSTTATITLSNGTGGNYNKVNWWVDGNFLGTNTGPSSTKTGLTTGTSHVYSAQYYSQFGPGIATPICSSLPFLIDGPTTPTVGGLLVCRQCFISGGRSDTKWTYKADCSDKSIFAAGCTCQPSDGNINFGKNGASCHGDTSQTVNPPVDSSLGGKGLLLENGTYKWAPDDLYFTFWVGSVGGSSLCVVSINTPTGPACVFYPSFQTHHDPALPGSGYGPGEGYGFKTGAVRTTGNEPEDFFNTIYLTGWNPNYEPVGYIPFQRVDLRGGDYRCYATENNEANAYYYPSIYYANVNTIGPTPGPTSMYSAPLFRWGGYYGHDNGNNVGHNGTGFCNPRNFSGGVGSPGWNACVAAISPAAMGTPEQCASSSHPNVMCNNSGDNPKGFYCVPEFETGKNAQWVDAAARVDFVFQKAPQLPGLFELTVSPGCDDAAQLKSYESLSWTPSANAVKYLIYRQDKGSTPIAQIDQVGGVIQTSYVDTQATTPRTTYSYSVRAFSSDGSCLDNDGNTCSGSGAGNWVGDQTGYCETVPPNVSVSWLPNCINSGTWSTIQPQPIKATATDTGSGIDHVDFALVRTSPPPITTTSYTPPNPPHPPGEPEGVWQYIIPTAPEIGSYDIRVSATDKAGNYSSTHWPFVMGSQSCSYPWIQTTGGDVHSNTLIDAGRRQYN